MFTLEIIQKEPRWGQNRKKLIFAHWIFTILDWHQLNLKKNTEVFKYSFFYLKLKNGQTRSFNVKGLDNSFYASLFFSWLTHIHVKQHPKK